MKSNHEETKNTKKEKRRKKRKDLPVLRFFVVALSPRGFMTRKAPQRLIEN